MNTKLRHTSHSSGFSLIEILVALFMVTLVFIVVIGGETDNRNALDEDLEKIERAIRFSVNETILRNSMVRIKFSMDSYPATFQVEAGPQDAFVLPEFQYYDEATSLSLEEEENFEQVKKDVDSKFIPIPEFADGPTNLEDGVTLIGLATNLRSNVLFNAGEAFIYFYPTGERDASLIILATDDEIATIDVEPLIDRTTRSYLPLTNPLEEDILELQVRRANELHKEWVSSF